MRYLSLLLGTLLLLSTPVRAELMLDDSKLEETARELFKELRCMTCQGQSLDESNAALALEMRNAIRVKLRKGDDAESIKTFLYERYGDFVLLEPPLKKETYPLWFLPFALVAAGGFVLLRYIRGARKTR